MAHKHSELFYLMGASGSGKDTLLRCVRTRMAPEAPIRFARRYVTRPSGQDGENHIGVTEIEFESLLRNGRFAMHWTSHGLRYGIGIEISRWLEDGFDVVVNGSRRYFSEAARMYPNIIPVSISVSEKLLRERLRQRGRESAAEIEERLVRARAVSGPVQHPRLITIDNNGPLEEACRKLIAVLTSHGTSVNHRPTCCI
jgi:ribose 1,5-bisphosphokinase